jgi:hypothetical protein
MTRRTNPGFEKAHPMKSCLSVLFSIALLLLTPSASYAEMAAATVCPPVSIGQQNLAKNPDFVACIPGQVSCVGSSCSISSASAAPGWTMHTDNVGSKITTACVAPSQVPEKGGQWMLRVTATAAEGGVFQNLNPSTTERSMFSVWVRVQSGRVGIQLQKGPDGPKARSAKQGEWEQLRVCTDGTVSVDSIVIYNQAPGGGTFDIDRVEVLRTP